MARVQPRSLGGLVALVGGGFTLLICVLGLAIYGVVHEAIEQHLDDRITAEAAALVAAGKSGGLAGVLNAVRTREATHGAGDLGYIVTDAAGRRVGGTLNAVTPAPGYTEFVHYRLANGDHGVAQAVNVAIPGGGRLVVAAERAAVEQMDSLILALFGAAAALILLFGIGLTVAVRRVVRRRLGLIGATAEAIMAGDLSRRMPLPGDEAFDQVSIVINRMLERIELLLGNLRQLSTDIAHDIRSPLTRVRNAVETFGRAEDGPAAEQLRADTIGEIDDLLELLGGLLGISEIEGFAVRKRFVPLDLSRLTLDLVEGYRPAVEAAGLDIAFDGSPARIMGDPSLLRRCIANLIDNVIVHATGATRVAVALAVREASVILSVGDDGEGIPAEARETIFRRFVRLDRSRSQPGHGLGLAMVDAIMRAHHGQARAVAGDAGLTIALEFPRAAGAEDSAG